jgi:AcrR family transcriptional regulator
MSTNKLQDLLQASTKLLALGGVGALSMRLLGETVGIQPSVIYYYFKSKEDLLLRTFNYCVNKLADSLNSLPSDMKTVQDMLHQRIEYQFDNAEVMMAMLGYIMHSQATQQGTDAKRVPPMIYKHIRDVLERGVEEGIFAIEDISGEAKTITHTINGFILEYYPHVPKAEKRTALINQIHGFILRALT